MKEAERQPRSRLVTKILLGGFVTLVTAPTLIGPAAGGWLASQQAGSLPRGGGLGAAAGFLGAIPWAVGAFLAASGTLDTTSIGAGPVSIGVEAVSAETLALWQELGIVLALGATVVGLAVCGGLARHHSAASMRDPHSSLTGE